MADLNVQPKKSSGLWLWVLLALIAIALIYFFSKGCNKTANEATTSATHADTLKPVTTGNVQSENGEWQDVNFNSPTANYSEISGKNISVRGNDKYSIYSLGSNILFDVGKSTITKDGETSLKQIAASLNQRYKDGDIRIYGHTDSTGNASDNQQLAQQRGDAVKNWLEKNASIADDHISVNPLGESQPVATNATEQGRQQNRSVEIVARKH